MTVHGKKYKLTEILGRHGNTFQLTGNCQGIHQLCLQIYQTIETFHIPEKQYHLEKF